MSELSEEKKRVLKILIRSLHSGANLSEVKNIFTEVTKEASPVEIAKIEEELIKEGLPREEVMTLCDVHLAALKKFPETLKIEVPPGHPISILLQEHAFVKGVVQEMSPLVFSLEQDKDFGENEMTKAEELLGHLKEYNKHKVREENCLFPYLERHGVTQPPAIMWAEHDDQRQAIKEATRNLEGDKNIKPVAAADVSKIFAKNIDQVKKLIHKIVQLTPQKRGCNCGKALEGAEL